MSDDLQIPPVPPECDLRDFAYIPLEFRRLFTSETWMLGTDAAKLAALHLWCESWHQVPAASLPDNDRLLSLLSQAGSRWGRVKAQAMRGWMKCSDGRLYHPVVAEKALTAWREKIAHRARTHAARAAALRKRIAAATGDDKAVLEHQLQTLLQESVTSTKGKGEGEFKGQGKGEGQGLETSSAAVRRLPGEGLTVPTWKAYSEAYQQRYRVEPVRNRTVNAMLGRLVERIGATEAPQIAAFYLTHSRSDYVRGKHPVNLLLRDCEGLRTEWATGRQVTDAEARQADQTASRGSQAERLKAANA